MYNFQYQEVPPPIDKDGTNDFMNWIKMLYQELEQSVQSLEDEKERLNKITPEQLDNLQPR